MENKQSRKSEGSSICSDLEQMNMADFALDEFEAKSNDATVELVELKKEMETMKLSNKADSNEIGSKLDGKIDRLEKYFDEKLVANETKIGNLDMEIGRLINGMENVKKMMEEKPNESMEEKLAKTEETMAKLKKEIDQKDHKLAEHEAKIESLEEQLSSQDKILEKRGAKICTLIEEIGQKDEKLAEKNEEICALEEEIVGLKSEIGQNDQKMEKKDEEICALKEEIDVLKKEMGQNKQQLDEKELKIYKLEYEIEQQDEKLTSKICELQREIGSLQEEIGQNDQILEEKDEEIYSLEEKNTYLRGKMEEKEAKIGTLENEIDGQKAKIGQKDQKLAEHEAKIGGLENEIAKHKKVMVDLQSIIAKSKIDQHSPIDATNSSNANPTKAPTTTTSLNLYGYCASCEQAFLQTDWARQVGDLYYHAGCFKCDHCRLQFLAGEEFGQDFKIQRKNRALGKMVPRILCKKDYMNLVAEEKSTQVVNAVKVSDPGTKYPYAGSTWQIYD